MFATFRKPEGRRKNRVRKNKEREKGRNWGGGERKEWGGKRERK